MTTHLLGKLLFALCLSLAVLAFSLPPTVQAADDLEDLNSDQKAYVLKLRAAYDAAVSVTNDIGEMVTRGTFETALTDEKLGTEFIATQLATGNSMLAASAATLQEAPPTSMAGLRGTNQEAAAVFAEGYTPCGGLVSEESGNQAVEWGQGVMEDLFGVAPGEGDSVSATRIVACIAAQNEKIREATRQGKQALEARVQEIQHEEEVERDLLGDQAASMCFIATAAYGTASAEEIEVLRDFRDDVLLQSAAGRDYVGFYYAVSPPIADFIAGHKWLRTVVRECFVNPIVRAVRTASPLWSAP
jgi:hypothetical protein